MDQKQHTLHIFKQSIENKLQRYEGMYECDCPHLNRKLPFRKQYEEAVITALQENLPCHNALVYASVGTGGLFADFMLLNKFIHAGYTKITAILIEELYRENLGIIQALLDAQQWFKQLSIWHPQQPHIQLVVVKTTQEYQNICANNSTMKAHIISYVDPDDVTTLPDFDNQTVLNHMLKLFSLVLRDSALFTALFANNNLRHMIKGKVEQSSELLFMYEHFYGTNKLDEHIHKRAFISGKEALPFEPVKGSIQIGREIKILPEVRSFFD